MTEKKVKKSSLNARWALVPFTLLGFGISSFVFCFIVGEKMQDVGWSYFLPWKFALQHFSLENVFIAELALCAMGFFAIGLILLLQSLVPEQKLPYATRKFLKQVMVSLLFTVGSGFWLYTEVLEVQRLPYTSLFLEIYDLLWLACSFVFFACSVRSVAHGAHALLKYR